MSKDSLMAGFIQFNPVLGDPEKNMSTLDSLVAQGKDADLLVIPELANSGYNFESKAQAMDLAEDLRRSKFLDFLKYQARTYNLLLVSGIHEKENGKLFNTAVLVGPQGLIGKYRKVHLFWNEFDFFEKGNLGFPVFDTGIARIGLLICFDWVFPEAWRILALKGADIICHPSNLVLPYAQQAVPVHGLVNRTYNITANRYGEERGLIFSGQSIVSGPEGEVLVRAKAQDDAVAWAPVDLKRSRDKKITPRNHIFGDRFPGDYGELYC